MHKLFLKAPDMFVFTKSVTVKKIIESFPELDSVNLGIAKSIVPMAPIYKSYKDFLTDFLIDESEVENDLISVSNLNIDLTLVFQFEIEDFGGMEAESMDPESEFSWSKKNEFTSLRLINGELSEDVRMDIEKKFLAEFKKCDHCNELINSIEL